MRVKACPRCGDIVVKDGTRPVRRKDANGARVQYYLCTNKECRYQFPVEQQVELQKVMDGVFANLRGNS